MIQIFRHSFADDPGHPAEGKENAQKSPGCHFFADDPPSQASGGHGRGRVHEGSIDRRRVVKPDVERAVEGEDSAQAHEKKRRQEPSRYLSPGCPVKDERQEDQG